MDCKQKKFPVCLAVDGPDYVFVESHLEHCGADTKWCMTQYGDVATAAEAEKIIGEGIIQGMTELMDSEYSEEYGGGYPRFRGTSADNPRDPGRKYWLVHVAA